MSKSVRRLYKELKPSHYALELHPDLQTMTFSGTVTIDLKKTGRPSQRITFHQNGLKITSATITKHDKKGDQQLTIARINNQNTLQEVRLHTAEMVYSGDYTITMGFNGTITASATGLYPCRYRLNGHEEMMLATQFESHHAREVFPCIDEPEAKATFDLTLIVPSDLAALANTPIAKEEPLPDSNLVAASFETTPKTSTYLLAFVIGDLQSASTKTTNGTTVSVWSTKNHPLVTLDFALDIAKRSVEFFENYFNIPYPLPKLDNVALPDISGVIAGMENWGLITYRESVLLAYPNELSQASAEFIAICVTHEIAHQWFGNLVTMQWWNDLWLNESFASIMEYEAVDALFPEWHIWNRFVAVDGLAALRRDATNGVQAVQSVVHHPDEINTMFDPAIVYAKGSRLLYMLKNYIGSEAFRSGLHSYFQEHTYSNTTANDLWRSLSKSSGKDIEAFMEPWLTQPGFPVVAIEQQSAHTKISQRHFLDSGEQSDGRLWPVPLLPSDSQFPKELLVEQKTVTYTSTESLVINTGAAGHYIVHYQNPEHRKQLMGMVAQQTLGPVDRMMLLQYAVMLAKAGSQAFSEVLEMLQAFKAEQDESVWNVIANTISEIRRFIDLDETIEPAIQSFIGKLIQSEHVRLGWDQKPDESAADRKLRATIIGLGVYAEDSSIIEEAVRRFEAYKSNPTGLAPELRSTVFGAAVKTGQGDAYDYLIQLYETTSNADVKEDISAGITMAKDPAVGRRMVARFNDPSQVKPQDLIHWLAYSLHNRHLRAIAWDWMTENWSWIEKTYKNDISYDSFPRYAASVCNNAAWAKKYETFFTPKQNQPGLARNIAIGLNEIKTRVAWLERDLASVQKFFKP